MSRFFFPSMKKEATNVNFPVLHLIIYFEKNNMTIHTKRESEKKG